LKSLGALEALRLGPVCNEVSGLAGAGDDENGGGCIDHVSISAARSETISALNGPVHIPTV
jgi:hypothetical protein